MVVSAGVSTTGAGGSLVFSSASPSVSVLASLPASSPSLLSGAGGKVDSEAPSATGDSSGKGAGGGGGNCSLGDSSVTLDSSASASGAKGASGSAGDRGSEGDSSSVTSSSSSASLLSLVGF